MKQLVIFNLEVIVKKALNYFNIHVVNCYLGPIFSPYFGHYRRELVITVIVITVIVLQNER